MATEQERNRGLGAYSSPGVDVHKPSDETVIITSTPLVTFGWKGLGPPPGSRYITRDDVIRVRIVNSLAGANFQVGRKTLIVPYPEQIQPYNVSYAQDVVIPTSNRTTSDFLFTQSESFLLGIAVQGNAGAPDRGNSWVSIAVARVQGAALFVVEMLASGYVQNAKPISWPGTGLFDSLDGLGLPRSVSVGNPAAGADWSVTVPAGARWRALGFRAQLVTSATVANRIPRLIFTDGVNTFFTGQPTLTVPASQTVSVSAATSVATNTPNVTDVMIVITGPQYLPSGFTIASSTLNIQAADQWSSIFVDVEEWVNTV